MPTEAAEAAARAVAHVSLAVWSAPHVLVRESQTDSVKCLFGDYPDDSQETTLTGDSIDVLCGSMVVRL